MSSVLWPLLVIVRLTLLDAFRRRIVWVLLILTVIVVGLSGLGFERLVDLARQNGSSELDIQLGVSQMLIVVAFMFSFILAMTAAFIALGIRGTAVRPDPPPVELSQLEHRCRLASLRRLPQQGRRPLLIALDPFPKRSSIARHNCAVELPPAAHGSSQRWAAAASRRSP